jgi:hypothetical protein
VLLQYTYGGLVEVNEDPLKLGRVKVRVPHVFGTTGSGSGFVATNDLPWALPAGMPAGNSAASGGFTQLPDVGDAVWVRFLDGEPEKPIWEWGMQTLAGSQSLPLHSYGQGASGSVGMPNRTAWTRYSQAVELNAAGLIATTSGGYRLLLDDSTTPTSYDGDIKLSTALGNMLEIDDTTSSLTLSILQDVNFEVGSSFLAQSFDYTWTTAGDHTTKIGGSLSVDANLGMTLTTAASFNVDAFADIGLNATAAMNLTAAGAMTLTAAGGGMALNMAGVLMLGAGASEPFVLGNQLLNFLIAFYNDYAAHTHVVTGVESGSGEGTAVPTQSVPPVPSNTLLSAVILGS